MRINMFFFCLLFFLCACTSGQITTVEPTPAPAQAVTLLPTPTLTPTPPTPSATPTSTPFPVPQVCSPLSGYALDELAGQVSNPYFPPRLGSDDPHQGLDLAEMMPGSRIALVGMPIQAVLSGQVVGVTRDRFPYGHTIIIETPLEGIDPEWIAGLGLPDALPEPLSGGALSCPSYQDAWVESSERSLYLLYAHLQDVPLLNLGDRAACGQAIGAIGESGNALSPHLHLEVRVGPSGMAFDSLAHYDPSASVEEMSAYCLWRVSGAFLTIDPFCVLTGCKDG
jgi:murein DD-endopeptidase MepM/ murein hydrolase activator NlpD